MPNVIIHLAWKGDSEEQKIKEGFKTVVEELIRVCKCHARLFSKCILLLFTASLFSCQIKDAESVCRASVNECDVPEYCTGQSEQCPENDFKMNGIPCSSGQGYCYNGQCPTHLQHCQRLWGTGTHEFITQKSKTSPRSTDILQERVSTWFRSTVRVHIWVVG